MIDNVKAVFSGFLFISTHISLDLLSLGSAEDTLGKVGNWTVILWQVVSKIFLQKIIKIW